LSGFQKDDVAGTGQRNRKNTNRASETGYAFLSRHPASPCTD
jgi:hypothetical protein